VVQLLLQALLFLKSLRHIEVYVLGDVDANAPPSHHETAPAEAAGNKGWLGELPSSPGQQQQQPQLLFKASLVPLDGEGYCC